MKSLTIVVGFVMFIGGYLIGQSQTAARFAKAGSPVPSAGDPDAALRTWDWYLQPGPNHSFAAVGMSSPVENREGQLEQNLRLIHYTSRGVFPEAGSVEATVDPLGNEILGVGSEESGVHVLPTKPLAWSDVRQLSDLFFAFYP